MCEICDPKKKYDNCICNKDWKNFDETLININNFSSNILEKKLKISTLTLCCNFNNLINLDKFKLLYYYSLKDVKKFYNSAVFSWHTKYQQASNVSIKLFSNGKVQVAGCKTIQSCAYIIRKAFNRLIKSDCFDKKENALISDMRICMINSDFKIKNIIYQDKLCEILSNNSIHTNGNFISIVYQPIKYPAINTKFISDNEIMNYHQHNLKHGLKKTFENKLSILIFRSGSIIITGGKIIDNYLEAYIYILNLIEKNNKDVLIYND